MSERKKNIYKINDFGLFIGLTTIPYNDENFFIEEIRNRLFNGYREKLETITKGNKEDLNSLLYKPFPFFLLGSFDLASISIIDNYTFGNQIFRPYSSVGESINEQSYTFKTVMGPLCSRQFEDESFSIKRVYEILESTQNDFPFISIASFKVNSSLSIGGGGRLIHEILEKISSLLNDIKDIEFITLNTFSWNEFTILFFSNNLLSITKATFLLRSLTLNDINGLSISDIKKTLAYKSLEGLSENKEGFTENLKSAHVFTNTFSRFGFNYHMLFPKEKGDVSLKESLLANVSQVKDNNKVKFSVHWNIKPGHLRTAMKKLEEIAREVNLRIPENPIALNNELSTVIVGKEDFPFPQSPITFKQFIILMSVCLERIEENDEGFNICNNNIFDHIRGLSTQTHISLDKDIYEEVDDIHYLVHKKILKDRKIIFSQSTIKEVRVKLRKLGISKILTDKIENLFIHYNCGIHDSALYANFIELRSYLDSLKNNILNELKLDSDNTPLLSKERMNETLTGFVTQFQQAYHDRFLQSYVVNEINDFNVNFNGGIQNLVTSYHGFYKEIVSTLGDKHTAIVSINGKSGVTSNRLGVELNHQHLFIPELLLSVIVHEASNYCTEYIDFFSSEMLKMKDGSSKKANDVMIQLKRECGVSKTADILRYFLQDSITLLLGYNWDYKLFLYWHWGIFFNESKNWIDHEAIDLDLFRRHMVRMILLVKVFSFLDFDKANEDFRQEIDEEKKEEKFRKFFLENYNLYVNGVEYIDEDIFWNDCFDDVQEIEKDLDGYEVPFGSWVDFCIRTLLTIWKKDCNKVLGENNSKSFINGKIAPVFKDIYTELSNESFSEITKKNIIRRIYLSIIDKISEKYKEENFYPFLKKELLTPLKDIVSNELNQSDDLGFLTLFFLCKKQLNGFFDSKRKDYLGNHAKKFTKGVYGYEFFSEDGGIPVFDEKDDCRTYFGHIIQRSIDYLSFVKSEYGGKDRVDGFNVNIMFRDENGDVDLSNIELLREKKEDLGSYLFDPINGIVIYDPVMRRNYFRAKAGMMKMLWGFSKSRKVLEFK